MRLGNFKKKYFLSILALLLFISFVFYVFAGRYYISEPMQDLEYKKAIIKDSHNIFYRLENLRPVVGEEELLEFIRTNNNNPEIYTPSRENIKKGIYKLLLMVFHKDNYKVLIN